MSAGERRERSTYLRNLIAEQDVTSGFVGNSRTSVVCSLVHSTMPESCWREFSPSALRPRFDGRGRRWSRLGIAIVADGLRRVQTSDDQPARLSCSARSRRPALRPRQTDSRPDTAGHHWHRSCAWLRKHPFSVHLLRQSMAGDRTIICRTRALHSESSSRSTAPRGIEKMIGHSPNRAVALFLVVSD